MVEKFKIYVNDISNVTSYREKSLILLEYMEKEGIAYKDNEDYWQFNLKETMHREYWDQHIYGLASLCNMCNNILQAINENKIEISPEEIEEFVSSYINLIEYSFPEGQNDNEKVYIYQSVDYMVKFDPDHPSLANIKESRRDLFISLIQMLVGKSYYDLAMRVFKTYNKKYGIRFRSFFISITNFKFETLSDFDLKYILSEIDAEIENIPNREKFFLQAVKKFYDSGVLLKSPIDKISKELIEEINYINNNFCNVYAEEFFRDRLVKSDLDVHLRQQLLKGAIEIKLVSMVDKIIQEEEKASTVTLDTNFKKQLLSEQKQKNTPYNSWLNPEQRYYLSIIVREYTELLSSYSSLKVMRVGYYKSLVNLSEVIKGILKSREEEYMKNIFNGSSNLTDSELKKLFIDFLKESEKCKKYPTFNFSYKPNYEDLYNKVKANDKIVRYISGAQNQFSKIENIDLGEGDFTNLVVVQVKVMERYLKEVIVQKMVGQRIYTKYDFSDGTPSGKNKIISSTDTADDLSGFFNIELATAQYIIHQFFFNNNPTNYFSRINKNDNSFTSWVSKVRNGYFHIHPVKNMEEAREIHYKTAYSFMKCIYLLDGLVR